MRRTRTLAALVAALGLVGAAGAETIRVPADYPTIFQATGFAQNGDTILVSPGIYPEQVDFLGKNLVLRSTDGPEVTILDGQGQYTVVVFASGEGPNARLEGFTVRNGLATEPGWAGGIECRLASPTIVDCVVKTSRGGDGVAVAGSTRGGPGGIGIHGWPSFYVNSATVVGCRVEMNVGGVAADSNSGPGGILIDSGGPGLVIRDCVIRQNQGGQLFQEYASRAAGGIRITHSSGVLVEGSTIAENRAGPYEGVEEGAAGGVSTFSSQVDFSRCRILFNVGASGSSGAAEGGTGGIEIFSNPSAFPVIPSTLTNCIVGWNSGGNTAAPSGLAAGVGGVLLHAARVDIANCSIIGNVGGVSIQNPQNIGAVGGLGVEAFQSNPSTLTNTVFWRNETANSINDNTKIDPGSLVFANNMNVGIDQIDPRFMDFTGGDLHLACGSPAIDAGTDSLPTVPLTDIDGDTRPSGAQVDIGADEFLDPSVFPTFCTANPNSTGQVSHIHGEGCLSIAQNSMWVLVNHLPDTPGLLFYGPNQLQVSFGDGVRCVGGSLRRLPPMPGMGMMISIELDLPALQIQPGVPTYFQYWYRDPLAGGAGFNLSDGLEVTPEP